MLYYEPLHTLPPAPDDSGRALPLPFAVGPCEREGVVFYESGSSPFNEVFPPDIQNLGERLGVEVAVVENRGTAFPKLLPS